MLTAVAAFAEALTHPVALGLAFALALLVRDPGRLRLALALVGAALTLPGLSTHDGGGPLTMVSAMLGGIAALLLLAELMLHLVLPVCRLAWHLVLTAWHVLQHLAAVAARAGRAMVDDRPPAPPTAARRDLPPIEPEP